MKRVVGTILSLILALSLVAACGSTPCEEAFNKTKKCITSTDCSTVGPAVAIAACEMMKSTYSSLSYGDYMELCKLQNFSPFCECNAEGQAAADKILTCKEIDSPAPACQTCLH
jgi:hypothetical protein